MYKTNRPKCARDVQVRRNRTKRRNNNRTTISAPRNVVKDRTDDVGTNSRAVPVACGTRAVTRYRVTRRFPNDRWRVPGGSCVGVVVYSTSTGNLPIFFFLLFPLPHINLQNEIDLCRARIPAEHVGWATVILLFSFSFLRYRYICSVRWFFSVPPCRLSFQTVIIAPGRMLSGIFRKPQFLDIVQSGRIKNET